MKKAELMEYVGKDVTIILFDDYVLKGRLGYADEFSAKHDWCLPKRFYIGNYMFRVSHVKKLIAKGDSE